MGAPSSTSWCLHRVQYAANFHCILYTDFFYPCTFVPRLFSRDGQTDTSTDTRTDLDHSSGLALGHTPLYRMISTITRHGTKLRESKRNYT